MWEIVRKWSILLLTASLVLSLALEIKSPNSTSSSTSWNHPLFLFSKDMMNITLTDSSSSSSTTTTTLDSSSSSPSVVDDPSAVLEYDFYHNSCPHAEKIVRSMIQNFYRVRSNVAPALLRLVFHDCFIQGCDASVLLDAIDGVEAEKEAPPNQSLKGFDLINMIKSEIELACPATVSCADILVLSAREAVSLAGGPFYPLLTGRRDSSLSFPEVASFELPAPQDDLTKTLLSFASRGFDERETVSLLGSHSIGVIHCRFFRHRLYNYAGSGSPDPSLDTGFLNLMRTTCNNNTWTSTSFIQDSTLEEPSMRMDYEGEASESSFGRHYYQSLVQGRGILHADQQLMNDEGTANWVRAYASDGSLFRRDFSMVMMKLSGLRVLTGSLGLIRVNCSSVDPGEL